ncbi:MAG: hypothetical protein V2A65_11600 [Candidatus Omnitrophota bacterium]
MTRYFIYQKPQVYHLSWRGTLNKGRTGLLTFNSAVPSGNINNDLVRVSFLLPPCGGPAVIVTHGLYEQTHSYARYLWKKLGALGFTTFFLQLPYHMDRTPAGKLSGQVFITTDAEHSVSAFRQAIVDISSLIDILEREPTFSAAVKQGIGAMGISLGAIILNTAFAVEHRIKTAVSILGAGNLGGVVAESPMTLPLVIAGIVKGLNPYHCRQAVKDYRGFLNLVKEKGVENVEPAWPWFLVDPLTYARAGYFRREDFLMLNGSFDLIIPRHYTREFWRAAGKPEIVWLPCSHFTSPLLSRRITSLTAGFLRRHLKTSALSTS